MERFRSVDWGAARRDAHNIFTKLIRTRLPTDNDGTATVPGLFKLVRCMSTLDLISLAIGSCAGTGMYIVSGMVAHKYAGPAASISFIVAAVASIFSGSSYAEFGVRVPNTTGSAYAYSYVTVGEFVAFIIGWNMSLEYLIGTSACARALSACINALSNGAINRLLIFRLGTVYGEPPDIIAFTITIMMTLMLLLGVKKSLMFNHILNGINLCVWVFTMSAGMFYVDPANWTNDKGFLPNGWGGVLSGAATCFYAFIGFDIIATTGEEARNPRRSIPLAIFSSLGIILVAYVSTSIVLTLIVPYGKIDTDSALVSMFDYVNAPICKYIVAIGAIAGLTVSMFGSLFPLPRILYAMARDGLIFVHLAQLSTQSGTPAVATLWGGFISSLLSLLVQLEILVEMMSVGTLLAYSLVSTCVLVLRYQPHSTNLIELLPHNIRTPNDPEGTRYEQQESMLSGETSHMMASGQRVMVRRVTRSSPDSDDSLPGEETDDYYRDDSYLMNSNSEHFYVPGTCTTTPSRWQRIIAALYGRMIATAYMCPGLMPWVDIGPATKESGMFVIKAFGILFLLIVTLDLFAAYGTPSECTFTMVTMILLFLFIVVILLAISRKPQNRAGLIYVSPGVPFVPTLAVTINIYLVLNLSILTLIRFTVWMAIGLVVYFKYGINHSTLETNPPVGHKGPPSTPQPYPLDRTTIQPPTVEPRQIRDRNIFEGDGGGYCFDQSFSNSSLLTWHESDLENSQNNTTYKQVESRYNAKTNVASSHTSSRPPWAYPDITYEDWDD